MEEDAPMSRTFLPGQRELERRKPSELVGGMATNPRPCPVHRFEVEHLIYMRWGDGGAAYSQGLPMAEDSYRLGQKVN